MAGITKIRVSDVINQANKGHSPISDKEVLASCPSCGDVPLSECTVTQKQETTYSHLKCGNVLVVIGAPNPTGKPWPGRGTRIGDFVIRNAVDLRFRGVKIPASPHALAPERFD